MNFDEQPEFRRPLVAQSRWERCAEILFGGLAKATLGILFVATVVLMIFGGGAGLNELPTTRKGWRNFLFILLACVVGTALLIHFHWFPEKNHA